MKKKPLPALPSEVSPGAVSRHLVGYPGSKSAAGVAERIIRQMPPHHTYVEGFAGHVGVFRRKLPAAVNLLIDNDPRVCAALEMHLADFAPGVAIVCRDFVAAIPSIPALQDPNTLLYLDPPYLRSTRTRLLYDCEFASPEEHVLLLHEIFDLPCMVMISGYKSPLYESMLGSWRVVKFPAMTRGGKRIEHLWCNFPEPTVLHDPRFAGKDYRERERLKRKAKRWHRKFFLMEPRERQVVAGSLVKCDRAAVEAALRILPPKTTGRPG